MMTATKPKIRYAVEYCYEMPKDEDGEYIMDGGKYRVISCAKLEDAIGLARTLLKDRKDFWGVINVEEQEWIRDEDIFEHEGRTHMTWSHIRHINVSDDDYVYSENDWERD